MKPEKSAVKGHENNGRQKNGTIPAGPDLLPEYCQYRDEGCELNSSCLCCPLPQCIYEQPGGKQQWLKRLRDREINRLMVTEGRNVKELALMFGVSQRTVRRALNGRRGEI